MFYLIEGLFFLFIGTQANNSSLSDEMVIAVLAVFTLVASGVICLFFYLRDIEKNQEKIMGKLGITEKFKEIKKSEQQSEEVKS